MELPFRGSHRAAQPPPVAVTRMLWRDHRHLEFAFSNGTIGHVTPFIARPTGKPIGLESFVLQSGGADVFVFVGELGSSVRSEEMHRLKYALPYTEPRTFVRFWRAIFEYLATERNEQVRDGVRASDFPPNLQRTLAVFDSREAKTDYAMLQKNVWRRTPPKTPEDVAP